MKTIKISKRDDEAVTSLIDTLLRNEKSKFSKFDGITIDYSQINTMGANRCKQYVPYIGPNGERLIKVIYYPC